MIDWVDRHKVLAGLLFVALVSIVSVALASVVVQVLDPNAGDVVESASSATGTAQPSASPTASVPESENGAAPDQASSEASRTFLSLVCPTDTALHLLVNAALSAGGWTGIEMEEAHDRARAAADEASLAARRLQDPYPWPADTGSDMPLVATEYLQILAPLEQMTDAVAAPQLRALWRQIRFMPRTAEKRVREGLGLGPLRTEADGCPPAPPVPVATPSAPGGAWTTLWESPSGNLRCGLAPPTGAGEARVACLDASTATLASMVKGGIPQFTQATPADAAGLPGGSIVDFDESISEYGFMCTLLNPQGMTCRDLDTGRGFYVRRGAQGEI